MRNISGEGLFFTFLIFCFTTVVLYSIHKAYQEDRIYIDRGCYEQQIIPGSSNITWNCDNQIIK